jgi:hypothetical protein
VETFTIACKHRFAQEASRIHLAIKGSRGCCPVGGLASPGGDRTTTRGGRTSPLKFLVSSHQAVLSIFVLLLRCDGHLHSRLMIPMRLRARLHAGKGRRLLLFRKLRPWLRHHPCKREGRDLVFLFHFKNQCNGSSEGASTDIYRTCSDPVRLFWYSYPVNSGLFFCCLVPRGTADRIFRIYLVFFWTLYDCFVRQGVVFVSLFVSLFGSV